MVFRYKILDIVGINFTYLQPLIYCLQGCDLI